MIVYDCPSRRARPRVFIACPVCALFVSDDLVHRRHTGHLSDPQIAFRDRLRDSHVRAAAPESGKVTA